MDRLHFGLRARRRARRARIKRVVFIGWVLAIVAGVPGATVALDWTQRALGNGDDRSAIGTQDVLGHASSRDVRQVTVAKELKGRLHSRERAEASPDPLAATAPATGITGVIYQAAAEFGLDGSYLVSVAECESTLDPGAYNAAGYHGLFQFDQTTWAAYGYGSIYDPVAQSRTAARLIAAGQSSRWPNCA